MPDHVPSALLAFDTELNEGGNKKLLLPAPTPGNGLAQDTLIKDMSPKNKTRSKSHIKSGDSPKKIKETQSPCP